MEEASVAGESPDRSKQHESSAEPTSGSKAPVPDPRLAVAREAVTAASRVDTATAVFSTKRSAGSAESEGSVAGSSQGSDGSADRESAGEGPAKGTGGGDARLRDVVAAWVATADDEAPEGASDAAGSDGSDGAEVPGAAEGSDGPESATSDSAGSAGGGAGGAAGGGDSDDEGESGAKGGTAEAETDDAPADEDAEPKDAAAAQPPAEDDAPADFDFDSDSDSDSDSETDSETDGDDAEPAGGADAEREPEGESQSEATDEAKDQPEAGADAKADAASEALAADASDESDGEGSGDGDGDAKVATDSEADAAPSAGEPTDEVPAEAKADAVPEAGAAPGADEPADEAPAGAKADAVKADAVPEAGVASGAGEPADEAPAGAKADAVKASPTGEPADEVPADAAKVGAVVDVDEAAGEGPGEGNAGADAESDAVAGGDADSGGDPEPPVDQPTAIFKMPARAVDQPTTMLKWGGAKPGAGTDEKPTTEPDAGAAAGADKGTATDPGKGTESGKNAESDKGAVPGKGAEGKPGPAWAAKSSAEAESERTSKFVALKPLDEPAPPKTRPVAPPSVPPAAETAAVPQVGPERTTQQPLPPKPPLDLLAELTNTPPPRQTPVRTVVRRVKIWTPLVLLLAVVFAVVQAVRPLPTPTLALTADESYAFEGNKVSLPWPDEGQGWMDVNGIGTVDRFGEQKPVAIGSVAKAMTAYVILKEHPLKPGEDGAKIPVDAKAETEGGYDAQGESTLNTVKEGDTLTEKDAIAAIMIPSANNIARLLARWDSNGSEEAFVKKMNDAAKDLGMTKTTYTDPSGLKETTVSTAEDQVKLGNELVRMQALVDITKLPTWVDPSGKKWDNYNRLVPYNNAIGIKTGSTTKAGGNLLFAATQEVGGENVIVVGAVLGQHKPPIIDTVNAVSKEAMIAAQEALTSQKILKKGDVVGYVDDGLGGRTPVVVALDVSAVGWAGQTVKLKLGEDGTAIPHAAKAGTKVGSLSVGDGTSGNAVEVPVALQSDLVEPGYGSKLTRVS
ncbi:D-alanyl-D-alanine carboxypeptidase [Streptomyces sp. NPDC057199]|uniref:D-alanyl-D-alanine carboxypeptidase n=1 Tax=Streptomyces sp. NPDC057199 TaxID=3346047 RepID=UPI00363C79C9